MASTDHVVPAWLQQNARRRPYWSIGLASFFGLIVLYLFFGVLFHPSESQPPPSHPPPKTQPQQPPIANDVFVVMKTGATVLAQKVPIHFQTTFQNTPSYTIYSDLEETFQGHHIYDCLDDIDPFIYENNPDFWLYRRLQELKGVPRAKWDLEDSPNLHEAARILDKYKFLPLMEKILHDAQPNHKWFLFIEADTYLMWSNLLLWLPKLNSQKLQYLGNEASAGNIGFAHGGSGFILSRPSLEALVKYRASRRGDLDRYTRQEAFGDAILAKTLKDAGVKLTQSWPSIQGETPASLDYTDRHWCWPVMSYHHMDAQAIEQMWRFTKNWTGTHAPQTPILHRDVFELMIQPNMLETKTSWDNLSVDWDDDPMPMDSIDQCREECQNHEDCVQFSFGKLNSLCRMSKIIRYGKERAGMQSEWMIDRINARKKQWGPCKEKWIRPS